MTRVSTTLSRNWTSAGDVAAACGLSRRQALRSLDAMYCAGLLERRVRGGVPLWRLTPEAAARLARRGGGRR